MSKVGKCVFLISLTVALRFISQRHITQVQPDILAFLPEAPHINKKTASAAFGTFAFTADLWCLSARGGKLSFIIQTLKKSKLTSWSFVDKPFHWWTQLLVDG